MKRLLAPFLPAVNNARLHWLRFKRDTCNPMAPHLLEIVLAIDRLERTAP